MAELNVLSLRLKAPLVYQKTEGLPVFEWDRFDAGALFLFELSDALSQSFEVDPEGYLGEPTFSARAVRWEASPEGDPSIGNYGDDGDERGRIPIPPGERLELPAATYLFAQQRSALDRSAFAQMAAEVQQEGLWRRLHLDNRLYLRYLWEDGSSVTQAFRPYTEDPD
jgi:hypothetical protein